LLLLAAAVETLAAVALVDLEQDLIKPSQLVVVIQSQLARAEVRLLAAIMAVTEPIVQLVL